MLALFCTNAKCKQWPSISCQHCSNGGDHHWPNIILFSKPSLYHLPVVFVPVEYKVNTRLHNLALLLALVSYYTRLRYFSSPSTVLCQVVLGLPCGLFPGGFCLRAASVMQHPSILKTCPSHLILLCFILSI